MNDYISIIQAKVTSLLKTFDGSLAEASKDRCSEIARLVGCWIIKDYPDTEISILKGEFSNDMAHDILVVKYAHNIYVLDPTVWQIFPESGTIVVCTVNSITEAIAFVTNKYGGVWKVFELLKTCSQEEEQKLLGIVC